MSIPSLELPAFFKVAPAVFVAGSANLLAKNALPPHWVQTKAIEVSAPVTNRLWHGCTQTDGPCDDEPVTDVSWYEICGRWTSGGFVPGFLQKLEAGLGYGRDGSGLRLLSSEEFELISRGPPRNVDQRDLGDVSQLSDLENFICRLEDGAEILSGPGERRVLFAWSARAAANFSVPQIGELTEWTSSDFRMILSTKGKPKFKVVRGAACRDRDGNYYAASRSSAVPDASLGIGFRLVRPLQP